MRELKIPGCADLANMSLARRTVEIEGAVKKLAERSVQLEVAEQALSKQTADLSESEMNLDQCKVQLRAMDQDLMQQVTELKRILEQREDLAATLVHDIKGPLLGSTMVLKCLLAGEDGALTEKQASCISMIVESNHSCIKMLENLVAVYQYERDWESMDFENIDLAPLLSVCLRELALVAHRRQIEIETELSRSAGFVKADKESIGRVFRNLLDNAIKFTPEGGQIHIGLRNIGDQVVCEIRDTGPGIPPQDMEHLFQRFRRGGAGKKCSHGTGLGLYLCKRIVDAHKGEITCESNTSAGTTFRVSLPQAV